ncbi:MAG: acetylglutamate kinase [Acidimicrobiia bacterium]|nr:acetylglutamate kinase [Acidimicrobiia bacterium]
MNPHADSPLGASRPAPQVTAEVLTQALPYIQRFAGRTVVIKFGGVPVSDPEVARAVAGDVLLMHSVGIRPVIVHGGGPQIDDLMGRLGKAPSFVAGRRVTDAETLDIARMVLLGKVNRDIVASINARAPLAVGVSGEDAGLIVARPRDATRGFVGEVDAGDPGIVGRLLGLGFIPVVSTIGAGAGAQPYNINSDTVAGALAAALGAERLVVLTDVAGLLADVTDPASVLSEVTAADLAAILADGRVAGGMIPKAEACLAAVRGGVGSAHLLNGTQPHVLLLELFTDEGVGTMIRPDPPETAGEAQ